MLIEQDYDANLIAYIHVFYCFSLDQNRFMHFAFALGIHFTCLEGAGPVRDGFITAATALSVEQCILLAQLHHISSFAIHISSLQQACVKSHNHNINICVAQ